jgi:thymidylate synthase
MTEVSTSKQFHDVQYLTLLRDILDNGRACVDRTGTGTVKVFSRQMRFDLSDGTIPLLTTKKMHLPAVLHEILWYLSGNSNIKYLQDNGIRIWNEWCTPEGHLNKVYGYQWRHWEKDDWLSSVVEIKKRSGGINEPFIPPVNEKLNPETTDDDFVGKKLQTRFGDWFTVVNKECKPGDKNSTYVIQFEQTSTIKRVLRPVLRTKQINIRDPYRISVYNEGCLGEYREYTPIRNQAYNLWYNMMRRCFDPSHPEYYLYGHRGVFVDKSWRCFSNFLRDIHDLPYFSKWAANPSAYDLDKDYFGSSSYSKFTCIFLPKKYNQVLPKLDGCKYIATNKQTGDCYDFTVPRWFAKQVGIKHSQIISTALNNSPNSQTRDWKFERIEPREGYVFRHQLYVDQIADVVRKLKTNPDDRRIMVSAWNVGEIDQMRLPPCHFTFQFFSTEMTQPERLKWFQFAFGEYNLDGMSWNMVNDMLNNHNVPTRSLSCVMHQRSCDTFLGVPFNIVQYSIITRMLCEVVEMAPGEFIWDGGDVHIYNNHIEQVKEQLTRTPRASPTLEFARAVDNIDDFRYDDFVINDYDPLPAIKAKVSV